MGFLSKLWKGVKNVFKGILKVFEPILKPLGKLLNSSFGKALMIGLSIFTLGSAMIAGAGAFSSGMAAGNGFISSFVEGGKVFLQTLTGMGGEEAAKAGAEGAKLSAEGSSALKAATESSNLNVVAGGTPELVGQGSQAGGLLSQGQQAGGMAFGPGPTGDVMQRSVQAGGNVAGRGAMLPEMAGDAAKIAELTKPASSAIQTTEKGHWLSKAADMGKNFVGGLKDFAMSEGGGQVAGSLIQGVGNYYTEKDRQEFEDRIRREWSQGDRNANIRDMRTQSGRLGNLPTPSASGIATAAQNTANQNARRPYYQRPYGATAGTGG